MLVLVLRLQSTCGYAAAESIAQTRLEGVAQQDIQRCDCCLYSQIHVGGKATGLSLGFSGVWCNVGRGGPGYTAVVYASVTTATSGTWSMM